jgi:propanediol dehydratase small subunit
VKPENPTVEASLKDLEVTVQALRVKLQVWKARERQEIAAAFEKLARARTDEVIQ